MYRRLPNPGGEGDLIGKALIAAAAKEVIEVWPDNWPVFQLFARLSTQWMVGMSGPTGLRYEAAYPLIDRMAGSPEEWDAIFDDLQLMEQEALKTIRESND
jgi:hypothetical protein